MKEEICKIPPFIFRYWLWLILMPTVSSTASAQDTVFRYYPELTKFHLIDQPDTSFGLDTSLQNFHRFHPAEKPFAFLHLGYLGAPAAPMFLQAVTFPQIDIGFHQFDAYWRKMEQVKLYDTRQPYTSFNYQQGSGGEIKVNIIHTQNITPSLSLGIDFNRLRTDGFYQRQESRISNFNTFFRYQSPSRFYRGTMIYVLNDLKLQQNGGVTSDSIFIQEGLFNRALVPVELQAADQQWKNDEVAVVNAIHFGRKEWIRLNDSVQQPVVVPRLRLQQRLEWEKRRFSFTDEAVDSAYYSNPELFPPAGIRDSLVNNRLMNEFRISKLTADSSKGKFRFMLDAYFRHSVFHITNKSLDSDLQSGILGGHLVAFLGSRTKLVANAGLNLFGRNAGDLDLNATWEVTVSAGRKFVAEGTLAKNHPAVMANRYESAYYQWDNDFGNRTYSNLTARYLDKKWQLAAGASLLTVNNLIYWNQPGEPLQETATITGYQLFLQKNFHASRFHFDNELLYQHYDNDSALALPSFVLRSSVYYLNDVFKDALQLQVGIDVSYRSNYFAPGFLPATGQFYIQRHESFSFFPVCDAYLNLKIRSVRAFLMFQNVNQDLGYDGNFSGYLFPMPDRAFKVGFQWLFWN